MDCRVVTVYVHSIIFAFCLTIVAALHAFAENFAKYRFVNDFGHES